MILSSWRIKFPIIYTNYPPIFHMVGTKSPFRFSITMIPVFLEQLVQVSPICYISASDSFKPSFFTTSIIGGFNLLWPSLVGLLSSFCRILCIQVDGLRPLKNRKKYGVSNIMIKSWYCPKEGKKYMTLLEEFAHYQVSY